MFYRWNKASELPPFEKVGPTDKQKVIIDYIRYNKNTRCATSCLHVEFLKHNKQILENPEVRNNHEGFEDTKGVIRIRKSKKKKTQWPQKRTKVTTPTISYYVCIYSLFGHILQLHTARQAQKTSSTNIWPIS